MPRKALARIGRELTDAKRALPCEVTHGIFVCCDEMNYRRMQVLITGAAGTPYDSGCFVFDVLCPTSVSPQCCVGWWGGGGGE